jgi:hypothetical protein
MTLRRRALIPTAVLPLPVVSPVERKRPKGRIPNASGAAEKCVLPLSRVKAWVAAVRCGRYRLGKWAKRKEAKRKEHCCECDYRISIFHRLFSSYEGPLWAVQ